MPANLRLWNETGSLLMLGLVVAGWYWRAEFLQFAARTPMYGFVPLQQATHMDDAAVFDGMAQIFRPASHGIVICGRYAFFVVRGIRSSLCACAWHDEERNNSASGTNSQSAKELRGLLLDSAAESGETAT